MNQNIQLDNEIDLRKLFLILWRGKSYIILLSFICIFFASYYLQSAQRKYTIEYNLKSVSGNDNSQTLNGLLGVASLSGSQFPSSSNDDFDIFKELITSREVSEIIFDNNKIIKDIFRSEWNETINNFSKPSESKIQILVNDAKKLLTGNKEVNYMAPNPRRLAVFIRNNIQINDDKNNFLNFTSQTSNPELMLLLIKEATEASDEIMRQRYINFSMEPIAFYKEKLRTARSREHREALASLIGTEERKLMLASKGNYFIAEPYIKPTVSMYPTTPKPKLILALALIMGILTGSGLILIYHAATKDN